jgi:hypothetical protein
MDESKLSPIKRSALAVVDTVKHMIVNDCDDETIIKALPQVTIPTKVGIIEEDYMSYDDAIAELKLPYNRNKLAQLAKEHGIRSHKFRNMPIGFHKDDITRLKEILSNN